MELLLYGTDCSQSDTSQVCLGGQTGGDRGGQQGKNEEGRKEGPVWLVRPRRSVGRDGGKEER